MSDDNFKTMIGDGLRKFANKKWISVKERLPEPVVWVLVFTKTLKRPAVDFIKKDGKWQYQSDYDPISHWMELPEEPNV